MEFISQTAKETIIYQPGDTDAEKRIVYATIELLKATLMALRTKEDIKQ